MGNKLSNHSKSSNNTSPQQQPEESIDFDIFQDAQQCDESKPNTRIQIILIGGKRETVKVNLSCTVLKIYAHVKALSFYI